MRAGEDAAPAGVGITHLTRSGGAGAPLAGNRTRRQELADDAEPKRLLRKRGPDADKTPLTERREARFRRKAEATRL